MSADPELGDAGKTSSAVAKLTKARRKYSLQAKYPGNLEGLDARGRDAMAGRMLAAWGIKDKSGDALESVIQLRVTGGRICQAKKDVNRFHHAAHPRSDSHQTRRGQTSSKAPSSLGWSLRAK